VFRNLVRNAVAQTQPGQSVAIVARARGGHLHVTVSDDGPGIPPDQLERIFERFHRVSAGSAGEQDRTGLGLPIARAIVAAHGGTIWAESPPGRGAVFHIKLPGYSSASVPTSDPTFARQSGAD
jgi:signal transduction histidine kinase